MLPTLPARPKLIGASPSAYLDRGNLGNAVSSKSSPIVPPSSNIGQRLQGLSDILGGDDNYELALTGFYITYIVFSIRWSSFHVIQYKSDH